MKLSMTLPHSPETAGLALWSKCLLLGDPTTVSAKDLAERLGAPAIVAKAIQAPLMSGDTDFEMFAASNQILTSFAALVRNQSAFFWILANGAFRAPFSQRISYLTGVAEGRLVGEGQAIGVKRAVGDKVFLSPRKVAGISVFSKEMLSSAAGAGETFLTDQLKKAIVPTLDAALFGLLTDGSTPTTASAGSSVYATVMDLRWLLGQVNPKSESRLVWVMSPDVGRGASLLCGESGFLFPKMSPTGGEMLNIPALVSDGLADGTLGLLDATGIAAETLGVELSASRHSTLQLDDSPDSPPTASTTMINLWQHDLVALMPSIIFGAERMRDAAWAKVTGITWDTPDSPAA